MHHGADSEQEGSRYERRIFQKGIANFLIPTPSPCARRRVCLSQPKRRQIGRQEKRDEEQRNHVELEDGAPAEKEEEVAGKKGGDRLADVGARPVYPEREALPVIKLFADEPHGGRVPNMGGHSAQQEERKEDQKAWSQAHPPVEKGDARDADGEDPLPAPDHVDEDAGSGAADAA